MTKLCMPEYPDDCTKSNCNKFFSHRRNIGPGFKVADWPLPEQLTYECEKLRPITTFLGLLFYPLKWQRMCKEAFCLVYTCLHNCYYLL